MSCITTLRQMASEGKLMENSLIWKPGMKDWSLAKKIEELKTMFVPPIPPIK